MTEMLEPFWRLLARKLAVSPDPDRDFAFVADRDGTSIRFVVDPVGPASFNVTLEVVPASPPDFTMIHRDAVPCDEGRLLTGDHQLDGLVFIRSAEVRHLGFFDEDTRLGAARFIEAGGSYRAGVLRLPPTSVHALGNYLEPMVLTMLALAERFSMSEGALAKATLHIIMHEPNRSVRAVLKRAFAKDTAVRNLAAPPPAPTGPIALADEVPIWLARLRAPYTAASDRAEAFTSLLASVGPALGSDDPSSRNVAIQPLVDLLRDPNTNEPMRDAMRSVLVASQAPEAVEPLALACDVPGEPEFRRALVELGRLAAPGPARVRALSSAARERALPLAPELLGREPDPSGDFLAALMVVVDVDATALRLSYLEALAARRSPHHKAVVASELDSPSEENRIAAVELLGEIGDAHTLPRLEPLGRFIRAGRLKDVVKAAIAKIRARISDDLVGSLTITDNAHGSGGELSIVKAGP